MANPAWVADLSGAELARMLRYTTLPQALRLSAPRIDATFVACEVRVLRAVGYGEVSGVESVLEARATSDATQCLGHVLRDVVDIASLDEVPH